MRPRLRSSRSSRRRLANCWAPDTEHRHAAPSSRRVSPLFHEVAMPRRQDYAAAAIRGHQAERPRHAVGGNDPEFRRKPGVRHADRANAQLTGRFIIAGGEQCALPAAVELRHRHLLKAPGQW